MTSRWAYSLVGHCMLAAVLLASAACGDGPERGVGGATGAGDGRPVYGGTVVIAGANDLDYANSLVTADDATMELLRFALFMPLIRYDAELGYEPYLAESWELLGDTGVVFHLRDDVAWHDGAKTTAYDVEFTYVRAQDPETAFTNAGYFLHWREVTVVDSFTVRFRFEPHADPLAGWPFVPIMPRHLLERVPPAELRQAEFNQAPVGNGPFRFVSKRANDRWIFEANPDFPAALGGRPYLDRVVWRVIPEQASQIAELRTGNVDVIMTPPATEVRRLDAEPRLRAIVRPSRRYLFIGWNGRRTPFDDARVRRALSMAMDRQEILDVLRGGYGTLAVGPIGPWHWAYADALDPLPYDPAAARALLAEAGLRDRDGDGILETAAGDDFAFELKIAAQNEYQRNVAQIIQADLAAVGVRMGVQPVEFTTLISQISSPEREFEGVLMALTADIRLDLRDWFHSAAIGGPFQLASFSNPDVDRIVDLTSVLPSREAALPHLHRLQEIMREEQPWTFLFYYPDLMVVADRVQGVEADIRGALVSLPRWSVAEPP